MSCDHEFEHYHSTISSDETREMEIYQCPKCGALKINKFGETVVIEREAFREKIDLGDETCRDKMLIIKDFLSNYEKHWELEFDYLSSCERVDVTIFQKGFYKHRDIAEEMKKRIEETYVVKEVDLRHYDLEDVWSGHGDEPCCLYSTLYIEFYPRSKETLRE